MGTIAVFTFIRPALLTAIILFALAHSDSARADELVFPKNISTRSDDTEGAYRLDSPQTGIGTLTLRWSDELRRLVQVQHIPLHLEHSSEIHFSLDMRKALATENELEAKLSLGSMQSSVGAQISTDEHLTFFVRPSTDPWTDYQIIMWQPHSAPQNAALKTLGIMAGMLQADHYGHGPAFIQRQRDPLLQNDMRWYVENIATDFYSPYHRWFSDHPVNWHFLAVQSLHRSKPADLSAFFRSPSLSDPEWLAKIRDRLIRTVAAERVYQPLYYSLGDETGIAELSAFWDFDFSDDSLHGMRAWLKNEYGSLDALNKEWGSLFATWEDVKPPTTDEILRRSGDNFSAWSDFKEWMDLSFARAIRMGTNAVHSADPTAYAAIEGAQTPGWGGYDYTRLARSVDVMELYDYGDNVEIVRSLNPRLKILTTSFQSGLPEQDRVWRELFRGSDGLILWDDKGQFIDQADAIGPRGRAAAPYFHEIRQGLGALLINSRRRNDGVAILYSPASMRVQWLLDWRSTGRQWAAASNAQIRRSDRVTPAMTSFVDTLEHMGLQPSFVSPTLVERGVLRHGNYRVLVLPYTLAMSSIEAGEIRSFARQGGVVISEGQPGIFDEHGRKLPHSLLSDLFAPNAFYRFDSIALSKTRFGSVLSSDNNTHDAGGHSSVGNAVTQGLNAAGTQSPFPLIAPTGAPHDVRTYVYEDGGVAIVALQRDLAKSASDLTPEPITMRLPSRSFVYDLRRHVPLGHTDRIKVALAAFEPAIFAISADELPVPRVVGPSHMNAGQVAEFKIRFSRPNIASVDVLHWDVISPTGAIIPAYSGNILADKAASKSLRLAVNDPPGDWEIRVTDALTGNRTMMHVAVSSDPK